MVAGEPAYLNKHHKEITYKFDQEVNRIFSAPFYFELTHSSVNKGETIVNELTRLGYDLEGIITFGDGHNDIAMIQYAGLGVAMGNVEQEVKDVADEITLSTTKMG